ncbi:hypothetical protein DTL42_18995 [Bremerella cremea]|uniref:Uncharacterized protein n=1 Tax=Bremerella cremea TaxID=1031537 RepID=A0A368KPL8_9BACT|nr:hypothetical protein [Bremerella cremea]RCS43245.1 hypothetical protein DTL42_18995 [Bremerella cremea]
MEPKYSDAEALTIDKLHWLLYLALIEIRHQGRELHNSSVFGLANLFHATPLILAKAARGESSYQEVMQSLLDKAKELNCNSWIHNGIAQMSKDSADD